MAYVSGCVVVIQEAMLLYVFGGAVYTANNLSEKHLARVVIIGSCDVSVDRSLIFWGSSEPDVCVDSNMTNILCDIYRLRIKGNFYCKWGRISVVI